MKKRKWQNRAVIAMMTGGCLLSGPCGITPLQVQDFATSALIRAGVGIFGGALNAALVDALSTEADG